MAAKPVAMIALEKMAKDKGEPADDGPAPLEGLEMAMQDLLSAIDSKDTAAMADAFKSACSMCESGEPGEY